jgi:hypothetical protein
VVYIAWRPSFGEPVTLQGPQTGLCSPKFADLARRAELLPEPDKSFAAKKSTGPRKTLRSRVTP